MSFPIEVMSVGTWNGFQFTLDHLKEMAENYEKLKEVIKPPIKLGHSGSETGKPALGWIESLKVQGNKLFAYAVDVPEILMKAIKNKFYRRVSSEVLFGFSYEGKKYGRVFSGLALLGAEIPAVKNLEDLQAYLTGKGEFEKVEYFISTVTKEKRKMADDHVIKELENKVDELLTKFNAVTAENEKLKTQLADQEKQALKLAQEESKKDLFKFCESQVKDGKMLPAQRDELCGENVEVTFTDETVVITFAQFKAFCEKGGKILDTSSHANDDEHKKDDETKTFKDPQAEVEVRVDKYREENPKASYHEAIDFVLDADEKLADAYTYGYQATIMEE